MGSVKLETRNEGRGLREWDYVPLSEPRIVSRLIKNRWKVDQAFYPLAESSSTSILASNGVFPFSEPVLVTYIDLDELIEQAPLTRAERRIIDYTMRGYADPDIAEHYGTTVQHVRTLFAGAVEKIVATENKNWKSWGISIVGEGF